MMQLSQIGTLHVATIDNHGKNHRNNIVIIYMYIHADVLI